MAIIPFPKVAFEKVSGSKVGGKLRKKCSETILVDEIGRSVTKNKCKNRNLPTVKYGK